MRYVWLCLFLCCVAGSASAQTKQQWQIIRDAPTLTLPAQSNEYLLVGSAFASGLRKISVTTILNGSAMVLPDFRTNIGLGTTNDVSFQSLSLNNPNAATINLSGAFPAINWTGQFGRWQTAIDIAQTVNPSDFVIADKCEHVTAGVCDFARDQLYDNHNQDGVWSNPMVVNGGVGYVVGEIVTVDTTLGTITASVSGSTMTVTNNNGINIVAGLAISGSGITTTPIFNQITPLIGGEATGGIGRYNIGIDQTVGSQSVTLDRCIVEPSFIVTALVPASSAIQTAVPWARGGSGRCIVDPTGNLPQGSTTLGGSGAVFTATFAANPPTLGIGTNAFAAIAYNAIPYMVTIGAWSDRASMGGLNLNLSATNSGPALAITNGYLEVGTIDQAGLWHQLLNGTVSAPALTIGGLVDGFLSDGSHNISLALNNVNRITFGANGYTTFNTGADNPVIIGPWTALGTYSGVSFNNNMSSAAGVMFYGGGSGDSNMYANIPTGGAFNFRVNGTTVISMNAVGLSLLGTDQLFVAAMTQTSAAQAGTVCYNSGSGALNYDATVSCLTSSEELKSDIAPLKNPLSELMGLNPMSFVWNEKSPRYSVDPGEHIGLGAFSTGYVDERLIARDADGNPRGWRQDAVVALNVAATQELAKQQQLWIFIFVIWCALLSGGLIFVILRSGSVTPIIRGRRKFILEIRADG